MLAGPFATMLLGDLGAEVIKVERPGRGDDTRGWAPPYDERGVATYFESVNRNKRSVTIDLSSDQGSRQARALAARSDVIVENFRPGLMEQLGLDYATLSETNSGLIYCSITGFGDTAAEMPGYDLVVQAVGGLMSITGSPDGPPQKVGVALVDVLAGLFASVGILTALHHRTTTGRGQKVGINLLSSLLAALVNQASAYTAGGTVPTRMGNRHPSITPYELYRCKQGELVIAVGTDRQFAALCEVIGMAELASDPRFATNSDRVLARDQLFELLQERLVKETASHWERLLMAARVPVGVVNDVGAAFRLADRLGLQPIVALPADTGGTVALPRNPIELSLTPPSYRMAPPALGSTSLVELGVTAATVGEESAA